MAALCSAAAWAQPAPGGAPSSTGASDARISAPAAPAAERLPIEHFASLPQLSRVALSPEGRQIAALFNEQDRTLLVTRAASDGKARAVLTTDNQKYHFNWVRWVSEDRLLVSLRFAATRHFVDSLETRLLSIKADGTGLINLVRQERRAGSLSGYVPMQQIQDHVIDWLPEDGRHVLLQLSEPERVLPAVYKVNVETGARQMVKAPERGVYLWFTDAQHQVRVGMRHDDEQYDVIARDPDGRDWRTLWTFRDMADAVWPLGFGLDAQELLVRAQHEGRMAVFAVRLDAPGLPRRLMLAHPHQDVAGQLLHSPATGDVLGLKHDGVTAEDGEARAELWNPTWRAQAQAVDLALPRRYNVLQALSRDEQQYLVYSSGNGQPGLYYLGDRRTGELSLLGETYPQLDAPRLAGKTALTVKARDGLPLHAYLTLPVGRRMGDGRGALPLVMLPHGGPASRDDDDFDPWTEFLADRGYAVLQVNFRGSDGYGHAFKAAGLKRWGLEMQDDLTDAVQWAVSKGLADPARVCIVGASYGGYAALAGAVKTPDLYRCAVSFAGVSDLRDLITFYSDYFGGREAAERTIGRVWGDREQLRATSPALHAERIRVPVLLVHGTLDRVVPVEQSQAMAQALRRAGKTHRYIEQEGGDHHLSRYSHRLEVFRALEQFLDAHLAPPSATAEALR